MGPGEPKPDPPAIVYPPKPKYSSKTPKLSILSGEKVSGKHRISFEQWIFKVRTLRGTYLKSTIEGAIVRSLKGPTADLMCYYTSDVCVAKMISQLETIYCTIARYDVLIQNCYKINMDPKEHVQAFATRMEGALNQIMTKFTIC